MQIVNQFCFCLGIVAVSSAGISLAEDPSKAIQAFVDREESEYAWKHLKSTETADGTMHELRVTSQRWQGIVWNHAVEIYEPKRMQFPSKALLFVTGGSVPGPPRRRDIELGFRLAAGCGSYVVALHQTPNQPLLGGRSEDDLISETWLRFLDTGDDSWPLLFPMVKGAVKTMDAIEAFSDAKLDSKITQFVITGASKRGWTSWLTPVVDQRVIATAPIVIDMLNFREQMKHQLSTWGAYSPQIEDYTSKGLVKDLSQPETNREQRLRAMMDPFTYRDQLKLPKLLIVGTNDPYWPIDAMNLYWDDLRGPKYIRQIPGGGHGLEGGFEDAMLSLVAFFRHVASGRSMPTVHWNAEMTDLETRLEIQVDHEPATVRLWTSVSDDNDFRDAKWNSRVLSKDGNSWVGVESRPAKGHLAVFGELTFDAPAAPWSITTLVYRR